MAPALPPAIFRSRRVLAVLNVLAVGAALASVTTVVLSVVFASTVSPTFAIAVGAPTFALGTIWAALLRWRRTVRGSSFRLGWAPLASLNAGIAAGLVYSAGGVAQAGIPFGVAFLLGATVGAIVWIPALLATMVCFGVPIAWAQRRARDGLAGEERGEWIVGLVCVLLGVVGALSSLPLTAMYVALPTGALATLAGGAAAAIALARERRRRRFVAAAEAGRVPGFRVDLTDQGKVLIRVATQDGGYRVADFEEELAVLDAEGAVREVRLPLRARGSAAG